MGDICQVLTDRIYEKEKIAGLSSLIKVPAEELSYRDLTYDALFRWLYSREEKNSTALVEGLVDRIGSFSAEIQRPPFTFEEAADKNILSEKDGIYYGMDGIRRAVIRFLGNVILRREKELFLYSDQNMDWMVNDPAFRAKWATLMALCIGNGTRINIIHNINRDLSEMADAISSWLPLYPSGMIMSYYFKVFSRPRFSTTMFLCPGYACISGSNIPGTENESGMYRYDTDTAVLEVHMKAYRELLDRCGELVHVRESDDVGFAGYYELADADIFGQRLSLGTMPEEVMESLLRRSGATESTRDHIREIRDERYGMLAGWAQNVSVSEYIPVASDEDIDDGRAMADLPGLSVSYSREEYAAHIRNILDLADDLRGYRFNVIPEAPFEGVDIYISGRNVTVKRLRPPYLTFSFEHPDMCRAFTSYASRIGEKYITDRLTTRKELERFLK